jgi:hypothetical protein
MVSIHYSNIRGYGVDALSICDTAPVQSSACHSLLQIEANRAPKSQPSQQSQVKQVLLTIIGTSNWCSSLVVYTNGVVLSAKSANVFAHLFLVLPIDGSLKSLFSILCSSSELQY